MSNVEQVSEVKELKPADQSVFKKTPEEKQALKDAKKKAKQSGLLK